MTQTRQVKGVATNVRKDNLGLHVRYHDTDVVMVHGDGRVTLRTGGWFTATTKVRMNQAANQFGLGFQVGQKDGKWSVRCNNGAVVPFEGNEATLAA